MKTLLKIAFLSVTIGAQLFAADPKGWIAGIDNSQSPYMVDINSTDPTSTNRVTLPAFNTEVALNKSTLTVVPGQNITQTRDFVVPWQNINNKPSNAFVYVTVKGVDRSGAPFVVSSAKIQDINKNLTLLGQSGTVGSGVIPKSGDATYVNIVISPTGGINLVPKNQ